MEHDVLLSEDKIKALVSLLEWYEGYEGDLDEIERETLLDLKAFLR
jgi:hypothetical protein